VSVWRCDSVARRYMAFQCLVNLILKEHVFVFYQMDPSALKRYYALYDPMLREHNTAMWEHLRKHAIVNEMYMFPWLQVRVEMTTTALLLVWW
jgi:hypothetical protein